MTSYAQGFRPAAGREELESAMRNRFYNNVSRPGSYGGITRDMAGFGRPRGVRGLGGPCDDVGANMAVGIIGAAARIGGSLIESTGRTTVGDDGAKSGGSRTAADAGRTVSAVGEGVLEAWTAACLSTTRGSTTGASPTESMDSVLARARATWAAEVEAGRGGDVLEASAAEARADRAALAAENRENREAAATTRNYIMGGVAVVAVVGLGIYFFK